MSYKRAVRVSGEIRRALSEIVLRGLKDPRIGPFSITEVEMTDDLRLARVRFVPLGGEGNADEILRGLRSASGYLTRELSRRVRMKYVPKLEFHIDETLPSAIKMVEQLQSSADQREDDV
jgi:ribosome-binding factor A